MRYGAKTTSTISMSPLKRGLLGATGAADLPHRDNPGHERDSGAKTVGLNEKGTPPTGRQLSSSNELQFTG